MSLLATDPYEGYDVAPAAKRVVSFLRAPPRAGLRLPLERDGARVLRVVGREAFSAYLPSPRGPVFMALIEEAFGEVVTTRTWETVRRVAGEGGRGARGGGRLGRGER